MPCSKVIQDIPEVSSIATNNVWSVFSRLCVKSSWKHAEQHRSWIFYQRSKARGEMLTTHVQLDRGSEVDMFEFLCNRFKSFFLLANILSLPFHNLVSFLHEAKCFLQSFMARCINLFFIDWNCATGQGATATSKTNYDKDKYPNRRHHNVILEVRYLMYGTSNWTADIARWNSTEFYVCNKKNKLSLALILHAEIPNHFNFTIQTDVVCPWVCFFFFCGTVRLDWLFANFPTPTSLFLKQFSATTQPTQNKHAKEGWQWTGAERFMYLFLFILPLFIHGENFIRFIKI